MRRRFAQVPLALPAVRHSATQLQWRLEAHPRRRRSTNQRNRSSSPCQAGSLQLLAAWARRSARRAAPHLQRTKRHAVLMGRVTGGTHMRVCGCLTEHLARSGTEPCRCVVICRHCCRRDVTSQSCRRHGRYRRDNSGGYGSRSRRRLVVALIALIALIVTALIVVRSGKISGSGSGRTAFLIPSPRISQRRDGRGARLKLIPAGVLGSRSSHPAPCHGVRRRGRARGQEQPSPLGVHAECVRIGSGQACRRAAT